MNKEFFKSILKQTKDLQILYVEDNDSQRVQTQKMLANFFDDILVCSNGFEGIKLFQENQKTIKIIFTDIRMPIMDGIKMCQQIRDVNRLVPIVILSAHSDKALLLDAIKIGIDGYLTKPYTFDTITDVIYKIVKKEHEQNIKYLKDGYYWDSDEKILSDKNHEEIKLSKNEKNLINLLLSSTNKVVSSLDIENEIFDDLKSDNKRVRSLISRLNLKLENTILIESVYAQGYKIAIQKY